MQCLNPQPPNPKLLAFESPSAATSFSAERQSSWLSNNSTTNKIWESILAKCNLHLSTCRLYLEPRYLSCRRRMMLSALCMLFALWLKTRSISSRTSTIRACKKIRKMERENWSASLTSGSFDESACTILICLVPTSS